MISKEDLTKALTHAIPYPTELDSETKSYMVDRLMEMCIIEKNLDNAIWAPEDPDPEPEVPGPVIPPGNPPFPGN